MRNSTHISHISHDLSDFKRNGFTFSYHALDCTRTDDVTEGRLSSFDEGLTQVGDTECGAVGVRDLEVDDRVASCRKEERD